MSGEPQWVPLDAVVAINEEIAAQSGELHEIRDLASLQKAVAHPWNKWVYFMDADIAVLAATLFASIGTAGGFATANKRTAFRAATAFLEANGCRLDLGDNRGYALERPNEFYRGRLGQAGVVAWFRMWMETA